jgi:hypothetical protein
MSARSLRRDSTMRSGTPYPQPTDPRQGCGPDSEAGADPNFDNRPRISAVLFVTHHIIPHMSCIVNIGPNHHQS